MPRWGRPPGVWQGNQSRRRATQWEDYDGVRFEEIDSDDDDGYNGVTFVDTSARRNGNNGGKASAREVRLRSNGYDYESEGSDGADFDLDDDAHSTVAYAVQLAMRDKEEALVEKALERIRRAQMLGKKNVRLSQEELDALERRRKGTGNKKLAATTAVDSAVRSRAPSINDKRPKSKDSFSRPSPRSTVEWRQGSQEQYSMNEPPGLPKRPSNGIHPSMNTGPTGPSSRPRTPTMQSLRPQPANSSPSMYQPGYNQRFPTERELSYIRALPDDPQWAPRQRSSSHVLPYPYDASQFMPQPYAAGNLDPRLTNFQGRRYPPDMQSFNNNYPPASQTQPRYEGTNPSGRHIPVESSEDDSSDNNESEDDDDGDDDDEGVQVVTQQPTVRTNTARTAAAGSGPNRNRETRRRRGR